MRLIDADALTNNLFDRVMINNGISEVLLIHGIQTFIDKQPAIDAVEVVRCKDCEYSKYVADTYIYCSKWYVYGATTEEDGFCHKGRRREL